MLVVNLAHPLTGEQRSQLEELTGAPIERLLEHMPQVDPARSFVEQAHELVDALGIDPREWQSLPIVVNLPGLAPFAAAVLAELHGRMGYFPTVFRVKPLEATTPTLYAVAEVMNLQAAREQARLRRQS